MLTRALALALIASCSKDPLIDSELVMKQSRAHEVACDLADRVGPRPAGSEGDRRAIAWALARMDALGLANVRGEIVKVPHWERGAESAELVTPVRQPLVVAALGQSVAATVEADVVRVGSIQELEALPDDRVAGRIVFFDKPMKRGPRSLDSYGEAVDVRSVGAAAAAKKGAVASLIRSVGTGSGRFAHTGAQRTRDGIPPIPAAALAIPDADMLARIIAGGETARVKLSLASTLHDEAESANVIGEVTGRELPEEIVLIGAHLDSWDLGRGAVDDGAGVGAALEVMRFLSAKPPRRTVRVVLFANEEHGLKGGFAYAKDHQSELAKHQAALEIDLGSGRALDFRWHGAESSQSVMEQIGEALAPLGVSPPKNDPETGGSDLIPLADAGVPKVDLLQDTTQYFDVHHSADDTCDKIVPSDLAHVTAAAAVVISILAEHPALLDRAPPPPGG